MFEKLYKEANEQIPINTDLLDKLKLEAKHPKKKQLVPIYKYGFAAAALLIITVSLNALPNMQKNATQETAIISDSAEKKLQNPPAVSESDTSPAAEHNINTDNAEHDIASSVPDESANSKTAFSALTDKRSSSKSSVPSSADAKQSVQESEQSAADTTTKVHTTIEENPYMENFDFKSNSTDLNSAIEQPSAVTETEDAIDINSLSQNTDEAKITSSSGRQGASGGGSSSKQAVTDEYVSQESDNITSFSITAPNDTDNTVFLSLGEYIAHFGFADILIPKGMNIANGDNILINLSPQNGELEKKDHTVIYTDNDKFMEINYKNNISDITNAINNADGEAYGKNCLISTLTNGFRAYILDGNKGYIITFTNLDKKTVYSVIDSIR